MKNRHERHRAAIMRRRSAGQSELISGGFARIVVAIAILAGIGYATTQIISATSDSAATEIEAIEQLVTKNFGNSGIYTGLTTSVVIGMGHLPSHYYTGSQILTPWHSVILLESTYNQYTGVVDGAWKLAFPNVPNGECNELAVEHFGRQIDLSVGQSKQGSTSMPSGQEVGTGGLSYAPPSPVDAVSACNGSDLMPGAYGGYMSADGMTSMIFTFG